MEPDDLLCSRNARPQKDGKERPGALLARRTRTIGMCSFDARSKGHPGYALLLRERRKRGRSMRGQTRGSPVLVQRAVSEEWEG